jgi:uncharacterized membrane protein YqiK
LRQIIIAEKNKQRTNAVETERVEKDRALEQTERERIVTLSQIEKERVIEIEKKNIQNVIRERVQLEKGVEEEQQNIKDIQELRTIERQKQVGITAASQTAEQNLILRVKAAEAEKMAAEQRARELLIDADAQKEASNKQAEARKTLADAKAREDATTGLAEAEVIKAKAEALELQGIAESVVIEKKAKAEALSIEVKADAKRKEGLMEAEITKEKALAEAIGIDEKAVAMKKLDGIGKEHEEFKLALQKEKEVELAQINIQKDIAQAQADVLSEALKSADIDIVGGETMFFENIVNQISNAKGFDRLVNESENASLLKKALLGDGTNETDLLERIRQCAKKVGISTEDVKNLTIASLVLKMQTKCDNDEDKGFLGNLLNMAKSMGLADKKLKK